MFAKKCILSVCLILAGCCSSEFYAEQLQRNVGISEMALIQKFGTPTRAFDTYYGRLIEFENKGFSCFEGDCNTFKCAPNFLVQNGIVVSAMFKGRCCESRPWFSTRTARGTFPFILPWNY